MKYVASILVFSLVVFVLLLTPRPSFSATASHVVISEVQLAGASRTHDFIELYNPTSSDIELSGYRLVKRTSSGDTDDSIVVFGVADVIPAHGYFLWCNSAITEELDCDRSTTASVANNNSLGLRNGPANTGDLVDSVTFGVVENPLGEGVAIGSPPAAGQSIERKACEDSTAASMVNGHSLAGNAWDTDNNSEDFVLREVSDPQNSSSAPEAPSCAEETPEPTATATATPTASPEPTAEPTETPEATPIPTATATASPEPTASPTPSPSPSPIPSPTTGTVVAIFPSKDGNLVCTLNWKIRSGRFFILLYPRLSCNLV